MFEILGWSDALRLCCGSWLKKTRTVCLRLCLCDALLTMEMLEKWGKTWTRNKPSVPFFEARIPSLCILPALLGRLLALNPSLKIGAHTGGRADTHTHAWTHRGSKKPSSEVYTCYTHIQGSWCRWDTSTSNNPTHASFSPHTPFQTSLKSKLISKWLLFNLDR